MNENIVLPNTPVLRLEPDSISTTNLSETLLPFNLGEGKELEYPPDAALFAPVWSPVKEGVDLQQRLIQLEEKLEELREEGQLKANFINAVVHDIRSPLTVVLGVLDLINEDAKADRPFDYKYYQPLLCDALQSCQEVTTLISDMLELSKMTKQKLLELNFEEMLVIEVVNSAMQLARGAARQANVKLSCKIQANLPHVYLDRRQMHRALMNLVHNAIKFTPENGAVSIRASFLNEKRRDAPCDYVLLSVTDTGEGLGLDEAPYVFDAYWQAQNGKRKAGTGLGLAIVKRIAVAHGGNVSVRSQSGKGSTFTIMIPVRDVPPENNSGVGFGESAN